MSLKLNLTGRVFGRLKVLSEHPDRQGKKKDIMWVCKCQCGEVKLISSGSLSSKKTVSCGCKKREGSHTTHGLSKTSKLYTTWSSMLQRCNNPKNPNYKNYGARGITVSKEWRKFENFIRDMGEKPSSTHSLDRINNELGYFKANCRWATPKQQARNKRIFLEGHKFKVDIKHPTKEDLERKITFRGELITLKKCAEVSGVKYDTIRLRLNKGWSETEAVMGRQTKMLIRGRLISEVAKELNLGVHAIYWRIEKFGEDSDEVLKPRLRKSQVKGQ